MLEKVTMVLKVDLQCCECYKKVKKILCKFPEIQDQTYDEKQNTVTIKVVSCCPEKLRDKLYCKGGCSIKCIEIKPPKKPEHGTEKPTVIVVPVPVPLPFPVLGCPPYYPFGVCCPACYDGRYGRPCYHGGGRPLCYDGCYERPVCKTGCNGRPPCNNCEGSNVGYKGRPPCGPHCDGRPPCDNCGGSSGSCKRRPPCAVSCDGRPPCNNCGDSCCTDGRPPSDNCGGSCCTGCDGRPPPCNNCGDSCCIGCDRRPPCNNCGGSCGGCDGRPPCNNYWDSDADCRIM